MRETSGPSKKAQGCDTLGVHLSFSRTAGTSLSIVREAGPVNNAGQSHAMLAANRLATNGFKRITTPSLETCTRSPMSSVARAKSGHHTRPPVLGQ